MVMGRSIPLSLATQVAPGQGELLMSRDRENPADLHRPVMLDEIVRCLDPAPAGIMIDATLGLGGHADGLLGARDDIRLIGLDRDAVSLELADLRLARWAGRYDICHCDYRDLADLAGARGWLPLSAVLVDMGASSLQLDTAERGFSFRRDGPLDMRMDRRQSRTAAELVNRLAASELATILRDYGDERYARRIARLIEQRRAQSPISTTTQLAALVSDAIPQRGPQRIHPATRTFQALRIAVNDELSGIYEFIVETARLLAPGGRLAVLSFHSLEDRPVKRAMRFLESDCECPIEIPQCQCDKRSEVRLLTRRPMTPTEAETGSNPRARSAKLRVLERI